MEIDWNKYFEAQNALHDSMKIKKEDVWGRFNENTHEMETEGMVVARQGQRCPVFNDEVPYKSATIVCLPEQEKEVLYWLDFVQGGGNVSKRLVLPGGEVVLRSDYMCW